MIRSREIHKKNPCVVDKVQPRLMSSVVVTLVQVMHRERSCPAMRPRIKFFVQILFHLATRLFLKPAPDEKSMGGRAVLVRSVVTGVVLGRMFIPSVGLDFSMSSVAAIEKC
jgi:hypothetical protein